MEFKVENLEHNEALLTVSVSSSDFEAAVNKAYNNKKSSIPMQGFRKGKAPKSIFDRVYGEGYFYEDAANIIIRDTYEDAIKQSEVELVSRPEIDIVNIKKDEDFIYSIKVAVKPEVTLGQYKGIKSKEVVVDINDEDVDRKISANLEKNARVVTVEDRAVQNNDQAIIDFEGFMDGKPFPGGQGAEFPLIIGSNTFIAGFEEQIIGMTAGEEKTVNVSFPEDYQEASLAGKPAEFKVVLKEIKVKEVPTLDLEFVEEVSEAESVEAYKEEVRKELYDAKKSELDTKREDEIVREAIEAASMDISELMINTKADEMLNNFTQRIAQQGLQLEQYFQFTGMSKEKLVEEMKGQADKAIRTRLVLEKIVSEENITATEEELNEKLTELANNYKMELDKLLELIPEEDKMAISLDVCVQKAIDLIVASAINE